MRTDHRLRSIKERLLHDALDIALKVLAPLPAMQCFAYPVKNLLRSGCLMDTDGLRCSMTEVLLISFVGERVASHRVPRLVEGDLSRPFVSEEPDKGADMRDLGYQFLMPLRAGPGNH